MSPKQIFAYYRLMEESFNQMGITEKEGDYSIFSTSVLSQLKNKTKNFYYFIYKNKQLCGVFNLCVENNKLFLGNVVFNNKLKNTHLILDFIAFVLNAKNFKAFDNIYFNINNKNTKSIKTFMHLGGEIVLAKQNSSLYCLNRNTATTFLAKFNR